MAIFIGSDHRGFLLKQAVLNSLKGRGYDVEDVGDKEQDPNDSYTDFATQLAKRISLDPESKGILLCGSGVGMCMTANKFRRVRAGLCFSRDQVFDARNKDNVNILCLPSEYISETDAVEIVKVFLETPFSKQEKYTYRLDQIAQIEDLWASS